MKRIKTGVSSSGQTSSLATVSMSPSSPAAAVSQGDQALMPSPMIRTNEAGAGPLSRGADAASLNGGDEVDDGGEDEEKADDGDDCGRE